jgi:hypothetical protein
MQRVQQEVVLYGFRTVAAALAQVAYRKADTFKKVLGDAVNASRWEVIARSVMTSTEVVPPWTVQEPPAEAGRHAEPVTR